MCPGRSRDQLQLLIGGCGRLTRYFNSTDGSNNLQNSASTHLAGQVRLTAFALCLHCCHVSILRILSTFHIKIHSILDIENI